MPVCVCLCVNPFKRYFWKLNSREHFFLSSRLVPKNLLFHFSFVKENLPRAFPYSQQPPYPCVFELSKNNRMLQGTCLQPLKSLQSLPADFTVWYFLDSLSYGTTFMSPLLLPRGPGFTLGKKNPGLLLGMHPATSLSLWGEGTHSGRVADPRKPQSSEEKVF